MAKRWIVAAPDARCSALAMQLKVPPFVATVLLNRGLENRDDAHRFLNPALKDLGPPEAIPGVTEAAQRIHAAVRAGRRIVIYGDYDVDGITGTAILWHCLKLAGADVDFYVPHRVEEGYGLNADALRRIKEDGADLVVTVDCGITAVAAAQVARDIGLELIITDHHTLDRQALPEAAVLVHPGLNGTDGPCDLCGAGVAFKLAWALAQRASGAARVTPAYREFLLTAVSLAALGTIADVVPLTGENRILTRFGLGALTETSLPGIRALIDVAGLRGESLTSTHVGFVLAPRINAAGRMGHARLAVELLTRADADRAREIAIYLEEQNRHRQTTERRIAKQARERVTAAGMDSDGSRAIVLADEGWHLGVIGIVASRLVEAFSRPTVLLVVNGETAQGSARSVNHFHLHEALQHCAEHLDTFGGHAMAAGMKLSTAKIPAFTRAFIDHANQTLTAVDLQAHLRLDAEMPLQDLTEPGVRMLERIEPFGMGNPKPRFATDWVEVVGDPRVVGRSGDHLLFSVRQGQTVRKAIAFGHAQHLDATRDHRRCRLAFEPTLNRYNGRTSVELRVLDIQFPDTDTTNNQ